MFGSLFPSLPKSHDDTRETSTPPSLNNSKLDPLALKEAADSLKDIASSPALTKAFDITVERERTKQETEKKEGEKFRAMQSESEKGRIVMQEEERRKTFKLNEEQQRVTAHYKAQLEAESYSKKLQDQKKQNDEWLAQQHEQFRKQEEIRMSNETALMGRRLSVEKEIEVAKIKEDHANKRQTERDNSDIHLSQLRVKSEEMRKTRMETLRYTLSSFGSAAYTIISDRKKRWALVGGITGVALGIYGSRAATRVVGNYVESTLGKPQMIRETSRRSFTGWSFFRFINPFSYFKKSNSVMEKIILPSDLSERLLWSTNSLMTAKKNGVPFRHYLLFGHPGNGKTLFARTLARECGMDYAIMTGGDVGPLGHEGVTALHRVFRWANRTKKGMILFIDEADAFLKQGRGSVDGGLSENLRNALSAFLHHTGTEQNKFSVILATNVKDVLDEAVLDRLDESFEFPLPGLCERREMINHFLKMYIYTPLRRGTKIGTDAALDDVYWDTVAEKTRGFSGRQMSKLIIAMQAAVLGTGSQTLTKTLAEAVVNWKVIHRDVI